MDSQAKGIVPTMMDKKHALAGTIVRDIMSTDLQTTAPETPVAEIIRTLLALDIGGLAVVDANGNLLGMVSDIDVIAKSGATAAEIMSRGVVGVHESATAADVATAMGLHGIRRVPVLRDTRLVGMVSRADLLRVVIAAG